MLSIIIPTYNEIKNKMIQTSFPKLYELSKSSKDLEVLIIDSFSTDGTLELAKKYNFTISQIQTNSRGIRLNHGIEMALGEMIILHHPRSILSEKGITYLINNPQLKWGAFKHQFDRQHPLLKFTSFYSNYIRGRRGIFYLDHCIFSQKILLEKAGLVPEIEIFEDTELCLRLLKHSPGALLPYTSITSAIRFDKNGLIKQSLLNQAAKLKYYMNFNHQKINKIYEKNVNLNSTHNENESGK